MPNGLLQGPPPMPGPAAMPPPPGIGMGMPPMGPPPMGPQSMPPVGMTPMMGPLPPVPAGMPMGMPGMGQPPGMLGMQRAPMPNGPGIDLDMIRQLVLMLDPHALDPTRKPWQEPEKPTDTDMANKISADQSDYQDLLQRFSDHLAYLDVEKPVVGVHQGFDPDVERYWVSSLLRDEEEQTVASIGAVDVAFFAEARTSADRDEAQMKENFLYYLRDEALSQYARAGFGSRKMAEVKYGFRYGRIVARNTMKLDADPDECPFVQHLIDPATCFPTWEDDRGLSHMTRVYRQTVSQIVGQHASEKKGDDKRIVKLLTGKRSGQQSLTMDDECEVREYYDRKWYAVYAAGILIKGPVAHNYGEVPFVYEMTELGESASAQDPNQAKRSHATPSGRTTATRANIAKKGQSAIAGRILTHTQREAMLGMLMTKFEGDLNPALIIKQGLTSQGKGLPEVSLAPGARSGLNADESIENPPIAPVPATFGPLFSASGEDIGRSSKSPQAYGLSPGAGQASGYAIEGLSESARYKDQPIIDMLERFHKNCGEQLLRIYRDWGHLLGQDGQRGTLTIPRMQPSYNESATFELKPDIIKRTGTRISCELQELRLQTLNQTLNALNLARQGGAITRDQYIRMAKLPGWRDPWRTMREVDIEGLKEMPEYKLAALLRYVTEEEQDPLLSELIVQQIIKGKISNGTASGGPPGSMPQPPQPGGPAQTPGISMPGMGQPPGPGSGPRGPMGPNRSGPIPLSPPGGVPPGGI